MKPSGRERRFRGCWCGGNGWTILGTVTLAMMSLAAFGTLTVHVSFIQRISAAHKPAPPDGAHVFLLPSAGSKKWPALRDGANLRNEILKRKLLFIVPRPDGFNNQRMTVVEGLRCAQRTNMVAVLPYMFSNTRYDTKSIGCVARD
jgi:hypothetical protein